MLKRVIKSKFIFFSLAILLSLQSGGMEPRSPEPLKTTPRALFVSPLKSQVYFPNTINDGGFEIALQSLKKTTQGDTIFADFFVLTDQRLVSLLCKQKKAGVDVSVSLCGSMLWLSKKSVAKLTQAGVEVTVYNQNAFIKKNINQSTKRVLPQTLHKKTIGWTYQEPEKGTQHRLLHGSRNFSYMTQSHSGKEANQEMSFYEVSKEDYDTAYNAHLTLKQSLTIAAATRSHTQLPTLEKTPAKKTTIQSTEYDIANSLAGRIQNTQDKLWLALYALNHENVEKKIQEVAQENKIALMIIDQGCLKNKIEFFKSLPSNTPIFVYNAEGLKRVGNRPTIMHIKSFVRKNNNDYLVGVGSANPTFANNQDINDWTFIPPSEDTTELAEDIIKGLESIKDECTPLQQVLNAREQQQKEPVPKKTKKPEPKATEKKRRKVE